jgi:hypothetical protein
MKHRLRERERSDAKGGGNGHTRKSEALSPMERFKSLARRLISVPREELEAERRNNEAQKAVRGGQRTP